MAEISVLKTVETRVNSETAKFWLVSETKFSRLKFDFIKKVLMKLLM